MNKKFVVYKHTNKINGKIYIGITSKKPKYRWCKGNGYKNNTHFYLAIQKYGWDNFEHEILISNLSEKDAKKKERELIAFYKCNDLNYGYNLTNGGDLTDLTPEMKEKIRQSKLGGKNPKATKVISLIDEKIFDSQSECAKFYKVDKSTIHKHCYKKKVNIILYMLFDEFCKLSNDNQKFYIQRAKTKIAKTQERKVIKEQKVKQSAWNKGKKCPQLTGNHNGMYNVKSGDHPKAKKIVRLNDNKIYQSIIDCAKDNNIHVDTVRNHCIGKTKNSLFAYITKYNK